MGICHLAASKILPNQEHGGPQWITICVHLCQHVQIVKLTKGIATQEREEHQVVSDLFIQPFQRWGIDLIGILPETPSGNRWIITAVDYVTGWPIAKAVKKATKDVIAEFIYDEIYMHFGAPQ